MGSWNYLWHFFPSVVLCAGTVMALEGRDITGAAPGSHTNVSGSTENSSRPGLAANTSDTSMAEPSTQPAPSPLGTAMGMVGDGRRDTVPDGERSSRGMSAQSGAGSLALPTARPGTAARGPGTERAMASSPPRSSALTSHSSSSSSSFSSLEGSSAVTPSPQRSSTSGTAETPSAITSHPPSATTSHPPSAITSHPPMAITSHLPMALVFSSPSSAGGIRSIESSAVTAEAVTQGPTSPRVMASTSVAPPSSVTTKIRLSSTLGSSTETAAPQLTSASLTWGQPTAEVTATSSSMGSPLASVTTASVASSAMMPPGEGESSTMNQGSGTTTDPNVKTSQSLAATSLVSPSTMRMGSGEGRTDTAPTTAVWEGSSLRTSAGNGAASPTFPKTQPGATAPGMGTESGTASSLPFSSGATESSPSSTLGSTMETSAAQPTSTPLLQGQTTVEGTATSSPTGSPSPSTAMATVGSSTTASPRGGESSTMDQESETTEPNARTSHSLPATSLATPSVTDPNAPTSVNPSFPTTCSPITLSIQLQNVTSTAIQFSWKPQGGTGDRPYTVRLLGKSGEMEEKILNETSTAFENLRAGRQYQISVAVSTCSKNVSTSLTVQTAAEVYSGTTRIINEDFKTEYEDKSSGEFKEFEEKFIMEITKHLPQKIQELKNGTKMHIVINSIRKGSVIVLFDIVLDAGQNITKTEISDAFTEALNMSTVFKVAPQETVIEARNSCQPDLNDCDQHAACTAEGATYSCQCNEGFTDESPRVPGRVCRQDLPSQQTTPAPPDTNTNIPGTGQTTPAPPNTNTNTAGTGQTTPAPPNTTTNTPGTGSTPAPPNTDTTNTPGTGSTTPAPPNNTTTNTPGTGQTTPAPPNTDTTNTTGTGSATPAPPNNTTTNTPGTGSATPAPPNTDTTNTPGTGSTTPAPPNTDTTNTPGTGSTTPAPPNTDTTNTAGTGSTPAPPNTTTTNTTGMRSTTAPPNTDTTNTTGTGSTTPAPSNTTTTNTTGTGQTTPVPPNTTTTNTTGTGQTTPAPPNTTTTNTTGMGSTTTVPPNTNTTGFTGSTSHSVFTTTVTSAPCMPVSVEVQNVTGEEIKLSWTSGSKGSLYIISLVDGNQEINKTTTKETKAVFDHLLPGHVYTISVAVSSCAESNWTSVTVRTDPYSCFKTTEFCLPESPGCSDLKDIVCSNNQALSCSVVFKRQTFNNTLYNSDSEDYKTLSQRIKTDVVGEMRVALGNDGFDIVVLGFRPGSVVADFLSLLPKEEPVDVNAIQTQLSRILRSKFGDETELAVQPLSVQSPTDNISPWRVAVIVLGVLLGVALVLILLAILSYIYVRRRSGKYLVEPSGLMGMFVYNYL